MGNSPPRSALSPRRGGSFRNVPHPVPPSTPSPHSGPMGSQRRDYDFIGDDYNSLEQVQEALRRNGLESSNLIVGIDFTKSNEWTGKNTFHGKSLHTISNIPNPYEQALHIIGKTLSSFDDDQLIPCFGFGDATTHDELAFNFNSEGRPCNGFEEALSRYRQIVPHVRLAGPTSFAPIVEAAVRIVEESGGQYHVLLIIADGQVTRSSDTRVGNLSPQEQTTINAITAASNYALSIVMVGVGDGPWDTMRNFDDNIRNRNFDNFQFVNFSSIMMSPGTNEYKEAKFALSALMEIPSQYKACVELGLIGRRAGRIPPRIPLGPPPTVLAADYSNSRPYFSPSPSSIPSVPSFRQNVSPPLPSPAQRGEGGSRLCAICFTNPLNMAFQCGHQTCSDCGVNLKDCPICRAPISTRLRLYS